jgi:hypothetical protein
MGSGSSKAAAPTAPTFTPDYSTASFSAADVQKQLAAATQQAQQSIQQAITSTATPLQASVSWWSRGVWVMVVIGAILLGVVLYDSLAPDSWPNIFFDKARSELNSTPPPSGDKTEAPEKAPQPTKSPSIITKFYNSVFGDSSGNLAPSFHDASSSALIKGKDAPLSSQNEGGYGMQWWMYVKDWNYGYGKKKSVVKRSDATNGAVQNPHISLHPTDNSLQISVSVFPTTEGGAAKSAPAPAGHSGSTDDVFVCEVPNIPLQTWFAVSVTVFGRNLDVYIDGKLVKSCFLSGVPKPAVGDISLTPDGGFSGRICDFYHYPRMLTPADTATFYNAGTSCRSKTEPSTASKATGYSVKFGVYDSLGKNVNEYTF